MAASDATYRNTRALNIIFAASSIVMLITIIGMFAEDYFRDWKVEQRLFYDVEEEMAKREVLASAPREELVAKIAERERDLGAKKDALKTKRAEMEKGLGDLPARKLKAENKKADVKASVDSKKSLYDIAVEQHPEGTASAEAQTIAQELAQLQAQLQAVTDEVET